MPKKAAANRAKYTRLVTGDTFLYKVHPSDFISVPTNLCSQDTKKKTGLWWNKILARSIRDIWFKSSKDHGFVYEDYFNPIPAPLMGLVFTTVCA